MTDTKQAPAKTTFQKLMLDVQSGKADKELFFKTFLKTEFYVAFNKRQVTGKDGLEDAQEFDFVLYDSQQNKDKKSIVISEQANYLQKLGAETLLLIKGVEILNTLYPDVEISIAYDGGGLGMPVDMLNWLRETIKPKEETKE
ncbi:hypothetical protein [Algibacillus agarilyticus]|uniref:hypothetical protein n=1 Tax=Algibacillus agarilyticus TaxID=2234133 RepID=UPI000DD07AFF|nr:hypothetical protein [Algibacillus agarilyticus]